MGQPGQLDALEPLIGRWRMTPGFLADADEVPHAVTTFDWLAGRRFLIQRWEVDHPDAPDGLAVIGAGPTTSAYVQHYFDARGMARDYAMDLADGTWTLDRFAEHPDFSQRFVGRLSTDGGSIVGRWESSADLGVTWTLDFDLVYSRLQEPDRR